MVKITTHVHAKLDDGTEVALRPSQVYAIETFYSRRFKVDAIKFLRMDANIGLKDAKDICDAIGTSYARYGRSSVSAVRVQEDF